MKEQGKEKVSYARDAGVFQILHRPVARRHGLNRDGYGQKIQSDYMLQFEGDARTYRIYVSCFSNVGVHFIVRRGIRLIVSDTDFPERNS